MGLVSVIFRSFLAFVSLFPILGVFFLPCTYVLPSACLRGGQCRLAWDVVKCFRF